ncbi:MAG: hypothetical protein ACYCS7_16190 [Acidimicrobiales bacterium]
MRSIRTGHGLDPTVLVAHPGVLLVGADCCVGLSSSAIGASTFSTIGGIAEHIQERIILPSSFMLKFMFLLLCQAPVGGAGSDCNG